MMNNILFFEIVDVTSVQNRGEFIFARSINGDLDFDIKDGATLGGIPIYNSVEMPRLLDANEQPRFDVFVFRPLPQFSPVNFVNGEQVELVFLK
jgi:hypothetical protein